MDLDLSKYPYRSTFTTIAKVIEPSNEDRFVAKASLAPLRGMIPADVNPEDSPDLLYIAADGAVAGLVNRNDDVISCEMALKINNTARNKFISVDHEREQCVGVVLYPGFSRFGSNEILTPEQAAELKEPFNMTVAGVLWKVVNPMLSKYLMKVGDAQDSDALSLSWEIAVPAYDVAVGSTNLFDAKIIKADSPDFEAYNKLLRSKGGPGKDNSGNKVFRVIRSSDDGEDPVVLGYSIVQNPAGHVKGINPVVPEATEPAEASAASSTTQIPEQKSQKVEEKIITPPNTSVNPNTTKTMKIESFEQLKANWSDVRQMESIASTLDPLIQAMEKGSQAHLQKIADQENALKIAQESQAAAEKQAKETAAALAEVQKQLDDVKAQAAAIEAQAKFNERMAALDEEFELDDEERAILAKDVNALASDEAFAEYMSKCKKLMSGKSKAAKKAANDKKDAKDGEKPGDKKNDKEPDGDKDDSDAKAALASVTVTDDKAAPGVNPTPTLNVSLADQMAAAFKDAVKVE